MLILAGYRKMISPSLIIPESFKKWKDIKGLQVGIAMKMFGNLCNHRRSFSCAIWVEPLKERKRICHTQPKLQLGE